MFTAPLSRQPIDIDYVSKAIVGIASPVLGVVTSFQEQIEWHLRVGLVDRHHGRPGFHLEKQPSLVPASGTPCF